MLFKKVQGAGNYSEGGNLEFVTQAQSTNGAFTLSVAPQAGDILVFVGLTWAYDNYAGAPLTNGFTELVRAYHIWNPSYYSGVRIGYKIATGSEGTSITARGNLASQIDSLAVYSAGASSVNLEDSYSLGSPTNTSFSLSSSSTPAIAVIGSVSYGGSTNSITGLTPDYEHAASYYAYEGSLAESSPVAFTSTASSITGATAAALITAS